MPDPLVSIIIPAFNRGDLIPETLDSVLNQSFRKWECIIVDDGSTDNTMAVVQQYETKDSRFKLYERPVGVKPGGSGAKNYGLKISKGKYVMFLDSDDIYGPDFIKEQVKNISGEPDTTICFSKYYTFHNDISDARINNPAYFKDFPDPADYVKYYCLHGYAFYTACLIASRSLVEQIGGWNEELTINDDGEFLINLAMASEKILFTEKAIAYYRVNPSGKMLFEYPEKAGHILNSLKLITKHIMYRGTFNRKEKYCATLFVHLKFLYPYDYSVWKKADLEIKQLGGKFYYFYNDPLFNQIWKISGLRAAFFYRRLKNFFKKRAV